MLKKSASAKPVSREASLVKRISQDYEVLRLRTTRNERQTKGMAFLSILRIVLLLCQTCGLVMF